MNFGHGYKGVVAAAGCAMLGTAALSLSAGQASADSYPEATVNAEGGLVAHGAPSTGAPKTHSYDDGATVSIDCKTRGTEVGENPAWYLVSAEGDAKWVSGRYLDVHGKASSCGPDVSIPATATEAVGPLEGPSNEDVPEDMNGTIGKGETTEVRCYVDSNGPKPGGRWLDVVESGWIPADAVRTAKTVPYCQQG